jgi:hypothetical protein
MALIANLPTATIVRRIAELREEIKDALEDSSLRGVERADLLADLRGDLGLYRDELEYRGG